MKSLSEKDKKELFDKINSKRQMGKTVNYSSIYGIGVTKLKLTLDCTKEEAEKLLDAYWKTNWSVKRLAKNQKIKKLVNGELWLYNPLSRFYYSLRYEKDIFSTLNQGTGVFIFDSWIKKFRAKRAQITGQFHDEVILEVKKGNREICERMLRDSIKEVNESLDLNREFDIDVAFGDNYSEIH